MPPVVPQPDDTGLPNKPKLSATDLAHFYQVSRRTIWSWVAAGRIPQPTRHSRNVVRWPRSVIAELEERARRRT